jgi:hypothetical protein
LEQNQSEESLSDIDNILNEIEKEFIKIVGPFGKYIFKKRKEKFFKKDNANKFSVLIFVQSLVEEIPEIKKEIYLLKTQKRSYQIFNGGSILWLLDIQKYLKSLLETPGQRVLYW